MGWTFGKSIEAFKFLCLNCWLALSDILEIVERISSNTPSASCPVSVCLASSKPDCACALVCSIPFDVCK